MSPYELLKAIFSRAQPTERAGPKTVADAKQTVPTAFNYQQAYSLEQLEKLQEVAAPLGQQYGPDFTAFLYRPNLAAFIVQEVIPSTYGVARSGSYHEEDIHFLDYNHWSARNPFNFPGPFYTGESDTCGTGEVEAPDNILNDSKYCEFIFRQPQNFTEFFQVLDAAAVEVLDSYSCDGNQHWTYSLCREWWRGKADLSRRLNSPSLQKNNGSRTQLYLNYLNGAAEADLRKYCYFLEHGFYPNAAHSLPFL